jgi:hypothetical protein
VCGEAGGADPNVFGLSVEDMWDPISREGVLLGWFVFLTAFLLVHTRLVAPAMMPDKEMFPTG